MWVVARLSVLVNLLGESVVPTVYSSEIFACLLAGEEITEEMNSLQFPPQAFCPPSQPIYDGLVTRADPEFKTADSNEMLR